MTDPTPKPGDELVSAYLDGEATPDERARVEADPQALVRLAEMRAVRSRLGEIVVPSSVARESAIAAALDVFDREIAPRAGSVGSEGSARPAGSSEPTVVDLDPGPGGHRVGAPVDLAAARARRRRSPATLAVAAAAVVVLVLAIAGNVRGRGSTDLAVVGSASKVEDARSAASESSQAGTGDAPLLNSAGPSTSTSTAAPFAPSTPAPVAGESQPAPAAGTDPTSVSSVPASAPFQAAPGERRSGDLGDVGDLARLRHAVSAVLVASPAPASLDPAVAAPVAACEPSARAADAEAADLLLIGTARYQGRAVGVLAFRIDQVLHPDANGPVRVVVVDPAGCAPVVSTTI